MKITNLYFNPENKLTYDDSECPLFAGAGTEASFSGDRIYIRSIKQGPAYVAFGGSDCGAVRLGISAGETYTAALKVHIGKVLSGKLHPGALGLSFGFTDGGGKRTEIRSDAAPNEIGTWEIHLTFTAPEGITGAWVAFYGAHSLEDEVAVSDVRITKTDEKTAPFGLTEAEVRFPYKDSIESGRCVREYDESIGLSYTGYIDYLLFARENGYMFDAGRARQAASCDEALSAITALFLDDTAGSLSEMKALFESVGEEAGQRIAEKLVMLEEYGLLDSLMPLEEPSCGGILPKLIYADRLANGPSPARARKNFMRNINDDNSLKKIFP